MCVSARGGASSEPQTGTGRTGSVQGGAEEPEETRGQEGRQAGELTDRVTQQHLLLLIVVMVTVCLFTLQEVKPEPPSDPAPVSNNSQSEPSSGDPETDKKIKNLKKVSGRYPISDQ